MSLVSVYLESLLDPFQHTAISYPTGRTILVIILIHFVPFSILVISSLTNPGSRHQDPIHILFPVHDFIKCVTGIFILFMGDDIIRESIFLTFSLPLSTSSHIYPSVILFMFLAKSSSKVFFFMKSAGLSSLQIQ